MARPLLPLILSSEQQSILETIARSREAPHSLVQRAQIVLSAHAGDTNKSIGQNLGLCEETVGFWRKRWLTDSIELEKHAGQSKRLSEAISQVLADKPRPGCPVSLRRSKFASYWRSRVKRLPNTSVIGRNRKSPEPPSIGA